MTSWRRAGVRGAWIVILKQTGCSGRTSLRCCCLSKDVVEVLEQTLQISGRRASQGVGTSVQRPWGRSRLGLFEDQ